VDIFGTPLDSFDDTSMVAEAEARTLVRMKWARMMRRYLMLRNRKACERVSLNSVVDKKYWQCITGHANPNRPDIEITLRPM
jgi:hypothetical protein